MTPQEAATKLAELKWSDPRIAKAVGSSQPTIYRIRHGQREAKHATGEALIALAKKEIRKQERAHGTHAD